jgi:GH25 family lysozyme M1 (1,4-beta-N-acetylmuramidase)
MSAEPSAEAAAEPSSASATSPGLFYPDISSVQGAIDLSGVHAVCIKHTEGTYYVNPDYDAQVARAESANAFVFAYHFLTDEDPAAQAQYCFDHVGSKVAVMADVETQTQTGSKPTLEQNVEFIQAFRKLGGIIHVNYLPQWYWSSVWGSPDLAALKDLGMVLVSSNYTSVATAAGWAPYGGWTPTIWQYSDDTPLNGAHVDFNVFLGSGTTDVATLVEEFTSVVTTGSLPAQSTWHELATTGDTSLAQIAASCSMDTSEVLRATACHYGFFDAVTKNHLIDVFNGTLAATSVVPAGAELWVLSPSSP